MPLLPTIAFTDAYLLLPLMADKQLSFARPLNFLNEITLRLSAGLLKQSLPTELQSRSELTHITLPFTSYKGDQQEFSIDRRRRRCSAGFA
jgi:hypothetical protein